MVDFTTNKVDYMALFWQHPKLWARSLLKRVRDAILKGDEASAFVINELHNELLRSIKESSKDVKALSELRTRIEHARNELDDLLANEEALSSANSGKLRQHLVDLAEKLGGVLNTLMDKTDT